MTSDLAYLYNKDLQTVFNAFSKAANERFGKDCSAEGLKNLVFGLNFSFKYNMNGGLLKVWFMPYQGGTAVNLHYVIAQLFGARYKAHARDLIEYVNNILGEKASEINLDVNEFVNQPDIDVVTQPNMGIKTEESSEKACISCGKQIPKESAFCPYCGQKQAVVCVCGRPFGDGENFCPNCGSKRQ